MKKYEPNYETSLFNGGKQQYISYVREEMGEKEVLSMAQATFKSFKK